MRKFLNTRMTHVEIEGGLKFPQYADDTGLDWYTSRDDDGWGSVVMTDSEGMVVAAEEHAEVLSIGAGFNIYEVDWKTVPENPLGSFRFDGETFTPIAVETSEPVRSKADIMADLLKLQKELEAM